MIVYKCCFALVDFIEWNQEGPGIQESHAKCTQVIPTNLNLRHNIIHGLT